MNIFEDISLEQASSLVSESLHKSDDGELYKISYLLIIGHNSHNYNKQTGELDILGLFYFDS